MITIVFLVLVVAVLGFFVAPMWALWAINTLAAAGGSTFYIPHTFWTYVATISLLTLWGMRIYNKD